MSTWKVGFIAVLGCACLALALATLIIPLGKPDGQQWLWLFGLVSATACTGAVFALFLRYAGSSLNAKTY